MVKINQNRYEWLEGIEKIKVLDFTEPISTTPQPEGFSFTGLIKTLLSWHDQV